MLEWPLAEPSASRMGRDTVRPRCRAADSPTESHETQISTPLTCRTMGNSFVADRLPEPYLLAAVVAETCRRT